MTRSIIVSFARRMPFLSRAVRRIEDLRSERDALTAGHETLLAERDALMTERDQLKATLADARAWLDITSKWLDRSKVDFDADGLIVFGRPATFLADAKFQEAYKFGVDSGHRFAGDTPGDLHIEWRAAICLWAAWHAKQLPGDFVECGVNTGILSRAICKYVDFNSTGKRFFLFDTYDGVPLDQAEIDRKDDVAHINELYYFDAWELIKNNFADFPNACPVKGRVPDTLDTVEIAQVAYLSIDMNITVPELAALEYFWPRMVTGGVIVFDDYGFHEDQRNALDTLTEKWGVKIWLLPTGQGLLLKP